MKYVGSILAVVLILLLIPAGDLASRERVRIQGTNDGPLIDGPGGEDHPWGGEHRSSGNNIPQVVTRVSLLDVACGLPGVGPYFSPGLYWFWTGRYERKLSTSNTDRGNAESNHYSESGSRRVCK